MQTTHKIVLATGNKHKVEEITEIFKTTNIEIISLSDFLPMDEVVEDANTFEGNALKKAKAVFEHTGLPSLADDSGLEVDALNGDPGVHSASYSGGGTDDNNTLLLKNLEDISNQKRSARFKCVMVLFDGSKDYLIADGKVEGTILTSMSGAKGFGYDPLFKPNGYNVSFAEMSSDEKNDISHRGNALKILKEKMGLK